MERRAGGPGRGERGLGMHLQSSGRQAANSGGAKIKTPACPLPPGGHSSSSSGRVPNANPSFKAEAGRPELWSRPSPWLWVEPVLLTSLSLSFLTCVMGMIIRVIRYVRGLLQVPGAW